MEEAAEVPRSSSPPPSVPSPTMAAPKPPPPSPLHAALLLPPSVLPSEGAGQLGVAKTMAASHDVTSESPASVIMEDKEALWNAPPREGLEATATGYEHTVVWDASRPPSPPLTPNSRAKQAQPFEDLLHHGAKIDRAQAVLYAAHLAAEQGWAVVGDIRDFTPSEVLARSRRVLYEKDRHKLERELHSLCRHGLLQNDTFATLVQSFVTTHWESGYEAAMQCAGLWQKVDGDRSNGKAVEAEP